VVGPDLRRDEGTGGTTYAGIFVSEIVARTDRDHTGDVLCFIALQ
jgi:hypothetical protein